MTESGKRKARGAAIQNLELKTQNSAVWASAPMGEAALLFAARDETSPHANAVALSLAQQLEATPPLGVRAVLPAIASVLVTFDPLATDYETIDATLQTLLAAVKIDQTAPRRVVEVPVRYGGAAGPDLADVASALGCAPADVVAQHTGGLYRVMMIGFAPGYPYIGPAPFLEPLRRRTTPRTVPAGSVVVAVGLTGIYPTQLPSGWHIIGRTNLRLFDAAAEPPTLFRAGDGVRFIEV